MRGAFLTGYYILGVVSFGLLLQGLGQSHKKGSAMWLLLKKKIYPGRKLLVTERFTKSTFNYGIQVTLRNLGIHKKLLTLGAKAMHLNN